MHRIGYIIIPPYFLSTTIALALAYNLISLLEKSTEERKKFLKDKLAKLEHCEATTFALQIGG